MGRQVFCTPAQTARKLQADFDLETGSHLHSKAKRIAEGRVKRIAKRVQLDEAWRATLVPAKNG